MAVGSCRINLQNSCCSESFFEIVGRVADKYVAARDRWDVLNLRVFIARVMVQKEREVRGGHGVRFQAGSSFSSAVLVSAFTMFRREEIF